MRCHLSMVNSGQTELGDNYCVQHQPPRWKAHSASSSSDTEIEDMRDLASTTNPCTPHSITNLCDPRFTTDLRDLTSTTDLCDPPTTDLRDLTSTTDLCDPLHYRPAGPHHDY